MHHRGEKDCAELFKDRGFVKLTLESEASKRTESTQFLYCFALSVRKRIYNMYVHVLSQPYI